jgi:hypothetical protein
MRSRLLSAVLLLTLSAMTVSVRVTAQDSAKARVETFNRDVLPILIEMPKDFNVPATGTVAYQNILVKVNFPEDVWVVAAEMRAGNRQVVHHGRVLVRRPGMMFMQDAVPGEAYETGSLEMQKAGAPDTLGKFNPGLGPQDFSLFESAKFIPKGSDLVFNMHYTSVGKATTDRSRVGLVFAKSAPKLRYFMHNGPTGSNLAIPAGATNAEVVSEMTTQVDAQLVYLQNCFLGILIDPKIDPTSVFTPSGPSLLPRGDSGPAFASLKE